MLKRQLFAKKSLEELLADMHSDQRLKRVLGPVALTALGIGGVIGAGIFVATGEAAHNVAGPALMVSYIVAGVTCVFAALCYAEFASMAPVAGSAYTYAYCTMGEFFAWIIGWDLVLEYAVGAAAVANGWSGYSMSLLAKLGVVVPLVIGGAPYKYDSGHILPNVQAQYQGALVTQAFQPRVAPREEGNYWVLAKGHPFLGEAGTPLGRVGTPEVESRMTNIQESLADPKIQALYQGTAVQRAMLPEVKERAAGIHWVLAKNHETLGKEGTFIGRVGDPAVEQQVTGIQQAVVNLPAVIIAAIMTIILVKGISESAGFNTLMVIIKVAAVLFVILVGAFYINRDNWAPFAPYGWSGISFFGIPIGGQGDAAKGMLAGAAIIFFAYIGFDSVSTHAEEARNPQRDVPIGIIASLVICSILYVAVVAVLTGMVKYDQIDVHAGVSTAFKQAGLAWAESIIAVAGVAGITSVLLVMMLSAPRVFLAMARDGLVPKKFFADVHPRFRTPWKSTILVGVVVAAMSGFLPLDALLHMTNIGTLFAFVIVCGAVLIMRKTNPQAVRPFRCPLVPVVPILGILCCLMLMFSLPAANWLRLIGWLAIGMVIYFGYGRRHSVLGQQLRAGKNAG